MHTEVTNELKCGFQRLIVRKRILRRIVIVLGWSFLPLVMALAAGWISGIKPVPYPALVVAGVMAVMVAYITAMDAKNIAIDVLDRLQKYPFADWFTVLSVSRVHGQSWPVAIVLRDAVGGEHKVYFSGAVSKIDLDDLENLRSHLANWTRFRWEPVLGQIRKHDFPPVYRESTSDDRVHGVTSEA